MKEEQKKWMKERCDIDAQKLVDMLFDNKFISEKIKREHLRKIEEHISFLMLSRIESEIQTNKLLESIK